MTKKKKKQIPTLAGESEKILKAIAKKNTDRQCRYCKKKYQRHEIRKDFVIYDPVCDCYENKMRENERKDTINYYLRNSKIPKVFKSEDMKDWVNIEGTQEMKSMMLNYDKNKVKKGEDGEGIILYGSVGVGKTKNVCWLLLRILYDLIKPIYFMGYSKLCSELGRLSEKTGHLDEFMRYLCYVDVLAIDDFAVTKIDEWRHRYLTIIMNERYYKKLPTFITTSKTAEQVEASLGEHIVSRIKGMCGANRVAIKSKTDMRAIGNQKIYGLVK